MQLKWYTLSLEELITTKVVKYLSDYLTDKSMPPKNLRWVTYGVTDKNKHIVKIYATKEKLNVGEALNLIIEEWIEFKKNNNEEI